jgi:hypothetical protein
MKVSPPLRQALRNNQRTKKLPDMLKFISEHLDVPVENIEVPALADSDELSIAYRTNIKAVTEASGGRRRFTFKTAAEVKVVLKQIKARTTDEAVFLFSTPLCESCGAIITGLHLFLDKATELVVLNNNAVYVIPADAQNCIDLTYDTEYSADDKPAEYVLSVKGSRFCSLLDQVRSRGVR